MKRKESKDSDRTPVTVYLPTDLVEKVDEAARSDRRSRSQMILKLIDEAIEGRRQTAMA